MYLQNSLGCVLIRNSYNPEYDQVLILELQENNLIESLLDKLIDRNWDEAEEVYNEMTPELRKKFKSELNVDDFEDKKKLVFLWELDKEL